ncbi:MAG: thioredoxin family protein [Verrucomicrobia bacterium CG_4_10_14_3_um_filter_43_23]|nr:MAG: hypothetical protein AUJ82_03145 [Verrucomicrobia bacterium CG1_02_43_26]PIP59691.1 MAG: thioredoxin family protein [Verrucomicrobia bacterium CG22_combo_CG10-13_8_21_14_all_43_17]PIX57703.1 MAG: thioredoxin family protein [Verrucomicrobia bacterium CG_4_10_14_3_um_filter_43_23]PIY62495.1 MAG: thioredoxin family protein [Verrucomicrobia bacterium CG_4_10_14_0_8_um_filter_43_34]PJA44685.1 MAG: thioredoxin family protein [Verrucomicrobia bacterium CG_4_9_14_3_um_filter_43_20]
MGLHAEVAIGDDAPDFSLLDAQGSVKTLSDNKGQIVILEWHDPLCAYVSKFYKKGVLQELQEKYTKSKIAWYMINSNAPGKRGYLANKEANDYLIANHASPSAYLFDTDGKVGESYGATVTPTIFIINEDGKVIYKGAVDDKLTTDPKEVGKGRNYIKAAIEKAIRKKSVAIPETRPYGCNIKYNKTEE